MNFTEIEKINNAAIVKDSNGKFGIKGSMGLDVYPKWNSYSFIPENKDNRYLITQQNGKYGIYDTVKVETVSECTMTKIVRYDSYKRILLGKELHKFIGLIPVSCKVEIELYNNCFL